MPDKSEIINTLVEKIVELVHPLQIILFGSAARGDMTTDSDIDLLVVMPDGTQKRETMRYLLKNIKFYEIDYDIVVATVTDLTEYKDDVGFIYYYALKEGKTVYDRRITEKALV